MSINYSKLIGVQLGGHELGPPRDHYLTQFFPTKETYEHHCKTIFVERTCETMSSWHSPNEMNHIMACVRMCGCSDGHNLPRTDIRVYQLYCVLWPNYDCPVQCVWFSPGSRNRRKWSKSHRWTCPWGAFHRPKWMWSTTNRSQLTSRIIQLLREATLRLMSPQTTRHADCIQIQYYSNVTGSKQASKMHFATLIPWFVAAELLWIIKLKL